VTRTEQEDILYRFFAGTFHEDWRLDASSPEEIVDRYKKSGVTGEHLRALSRAIRDYARRFKTPQELYDHLTLQMGCRYDMRSDGWTPEGWLNHVADRLVDAGA
jgi:hypothetical protein